MTALYLTRVSISRAASARALIQLLNPAKGQDRAAAHHRLLWTLFAEAPDQKRDFIWREDGDGRFLLLSARPPIDEHRLFEMDEVKPFDPSIVPGTRLRFALRANATVRHRGNVRHRDVVMDAIYGLPPGPERATARREQATPAARAWLDKQGESHGFAVDHMDCLGYETVRIAHGKMPMQLGVVDLEGRLTVTEPDALRSAIGRGFGRARAFGCGLMLIAPV
jgi:CRISPR system Cascade subunit CasE